MGEGEMKCKECEHYRDMLFAVVDELDLSGKALEEHGPLGTSPAELVRLVLRQKNMEIRVLKHGGKIIHGENKKGG